MQESNRYLFIQQSMSPTIARDSLVIIIVAIALALIVNAIRTDGIPLVAKKEFTILVPCPHSMGEATTIDGNDSRIKDSTSLVIDVRAQAEFNEWHLPNAINQPYNWLAEQDEVNRKAVGIAKRIARSGKHHVVIYGDGENPDPGEYWAALLSQSGIKNVVYVSGGAKALRQLENLSGGEE